MSAGVSSLFSPWMRSGPRHARAGGLLLPRPSRRPGLHLVLPNPGGVHSAAFRDAFGREDALRLLAELGDVQGRLDDLKRRLRELAEEGCVQLLPLAIDRFAIRRSVRGPTGSRIGRRPVPGEPHVRRWTATTRAALHPCLVRGRGQQGAPT